MEQSAAARKTVLYDAHRRLGARLAAYAGWIMPIEYSGLVAEHRAVREAAGLFDVSHMGEFEVSGPEALELVQYVTCNDASRLADGQAQYSALPTEDGAAVDDLLVYRMAPDRFMLVVNAANADGDYAWVSSHNRFDARVRNISDDTALLALQGPKAAQILQSLTAVSLDRIRPFRFVAGAISGVDAILSRTGYTGEDGFEIYLPTAHAETVWNAILQAGAPEGLLPAGLGARNTLRLEAGLLLYGNDLDATTGLLEAGLGWIVKTGKGEFVGRDSLLRQQQDGVRRTLAGFEMRGREIAREHYPVSIDGRPVGHVASGSPSITLKKNIGLAYLPVEHAASATVFQVEVRGRACDAQVVEVPFYKRR